MTNRTALLSLAFAVVAATGAAAQPVVALHAVSRSGNSGVCTGVADLSCTSYSVNVPDAENGVYVYLVIARGDEETGVSGVSFAYDISTLAGVEDFTLCADYQVGVQSGSIISWDPGTNCQQNVIGSDGVHAIAGVFTVGIIGPSFMTINPNQETEPKVLSVFDCDGSSTEVAPAAFVTFGALGDEGVNPCEAVVPTRPTTWGRMKSLFGR